MKFSQFLMSLEKLRINSEGDPPIKFEVDGSEVELVEGELKSSMSEFAIERGNLTVMPERKETVTIRFESKP